MNERPYVSEIEPPSSDAEVGDWLAGLAGKQRPFLLAFADDGIIWGLWRSGRLTTAVENVQTAMATEPNNPQLRQSLAVSPSLRGSTLQQASLFGRADEVRLFHDEAGGWQARQIGDPADPADVISESQLLIGSQVVASLGEFTHVRDRIQQGLDHIPPIRLSDTDVADNRAPRLSIRHHIEYDDATGEARIAISRLVEVTIGPRAAKEE